MPRKDKRATADEIARDFIGAIERLRRGQPNDPRLKEAASRGKLRINVSSVAREAGRSRTLLASAGGKFAHVRQLMAPSPGEQQVRQRNLTGLLAETRRALAVVKGQLKEQQAQTVAHFHARRAAERLAEKWKRAYDRAKADSGQPRKVIPFPLAPRDDSGEG